MRSVGEATVTLNMPNQIRYVQNSGEILDHFPLLNCLGSASLSGVNGLLEVIAEHLQKAPLIPPLLMTSLLCPEVAKQAKVAMLSPSFFAFGMILSFWYTLPCLRHLCSAVLSTFNFIYKVFSQRCCCGVPRCSLVNLRHTVLFVF